MAGKKISQLTTATTVDDEDILPLARADGNRKAKVSVLLAGVRALITGLTNSVATLTTAVGGKQASLGFTPENVANRNAANGYVGLTAGKISASVLPDLNFGERFTVSSEAAMLALDADSGDIAIRNDDPDEPMVYLLTDSAPGVLDSWTKLSLSAIGVTEVLSAAGGVKGGSVQLTLADIFGFTATGRALAAATGPGALRDALVLGTAALADEEDFAPVDHTHALATQALSGFMSNLDKARLDDLVLSGGGVPLGTVARFPSTLLDYPDSYVPLTGAVQKVKVEDYPTLGEVLSSFTESVGGGLNVSAKLLAPDGAADDRFGNAVAISADGNTLAVAAPLDDNSTGSNAGSVYVFIRVSNAWQFQARLQGIGTPAPVQMGIGLEISGDGNIIVAASPGTFNGAVYSFYRTGTTWSAAEKVVSNPLSSSSQFALGLALSRDGTTLVVGARNENNAAGVATAGGAYVFTRSGNAWVQSARLSASDGLASDGFGYRVAISGDGNTLAITAPGDETTGTTNSGSAYIFIKSAGVWTQQTILRVADRANNDFMAETPRLSFDGNTFIFASVSRATTRVGVFTRAGTVWTEKTILSSPGGASSGFGNSAAINDAGTLIVVGSYYEAANLVGKVYTYVLTAGTWTPDVQINPPDGADNDSFGFWVSMSGAGDVIVIGAFTEDNAGGSNAGSAYIATASGGVETDYLNLPARPDANWKWAIKA